MLQIARNARYFLNAWKIGFARISAGRTRRAELRGTGTLRCS
jgi:hypothetical protein